MKSGASLFKPIDWNVGKGMLPAHQEQ
jgi:hypothetical protein